MAKKKTKAAKARTPNREANEATQKRNEQRKDTLRKYDGIGRMMESAETRSNADVNQAAARNVRKLTEGK